MESTAPTSPATSSPGEPSEPSTYAFGTRAIHVGSEPDKATGAVIPPISLSTTFAQSAPGVHLGFEYSRSDNPNRRALEQSLASLEEGGEEALAFSSGSAALATVVQSLQFFKKETPHAPIHLLAVNDVYGGTYRYLKRVGNEVQGLEVTFIDMETADEDAIAAAIRPDTKLILVETPTNPTLKVVSIPLISRIAHTHPAQPFLMVDNTFASPFYQNPIMAGADLVLHSLTKYVNGHSDVVMGAVIHPGTSGAHLAATPVTGLHRPVAHPSPKALAHFYETLRFMQNALGAVPSAYDSWLAQRGIKTLHLRMKTHGANALAVARGVQALVAETGAAVQIGYAGLPAAPHDAVQSRRHRIAWEQLARPARKFVAEEIRPLQELDALKAGRPLPAAGADVPPPAGFPYTGMVTVTLPTYNHALTFLTSLKLFTLAESLGGVESLAEHPASMTHAGIPAAERRASGVEDGLVRLSVGVEDGADLVADVRSALAKSFKVNGL